MQNQLMEIFTIPFEAIPQLSQKDIAYATAHPALRPFYRYEVSLEAFAQVMADKQVDPTHREILVNVLREQYEGLSVSAAVNENIAALLKPNTFTVVTAHQPSLFTGPLFYLYKIFSAINLAEQLNERYPESKVVPVFISGAEDHDFEEVNHANLFGRRLSWDSGEKGPVGMMKTASLAPVLAELDQLLGDSENGRQVFRIIEEAYTSHEYYGEATQHLVHELFKEYGLVTVNMNHRRLKQLFVPIMRRELLEQPSKALVEAATARLEEAGFSGQAHAREINLFYLGDQMRERIVLEEGRYRVLETEISFSREEMLEELEKHPERFSPNVVMRPLFQECVLPNLAYIGGGGEIAYWLERLEQFAFFGLNFPMLIRRNSVLWIDQGSSKRMEKLGLSVDQLFRDVEALVKDYVRENTENELSLGEEKKQLEELFAQVVAKAEGIDKTLVKTALGEQTKALNSLEALEAKLLRAEKQRHDIAINQIRGLKDKLFPGGGLQERHDNFLTFYLRYGNSFLQVLKDCLHPLQEGFIIIQDQ